MYDWGSDDDDDGSGGLSGGRAQSIKFFLNRMDGNEPWEGAGQTLRQFMVTAVSLKLESMESDTMFVRRLKTKWAELQVFEGKKTLLS